MTKKYNQIEVKDNMNIEEAAAGAETKAERTELTKVVTSEPKKVKKSLMGRLITGLAGPDGLPGIGAYVNEEIVKPAIKNIIVDAVTSGINMVMYGEKGGPARRHTPYHRQGGSSNYRPNHNYNRQQPRNEEPERRVVRSRGTVEEYLIADRYEASNVIAALAEQADKYGTVSVADYYDLIGVETQYTDNNRGWVFEAITSATVIPVSGGYVIKFPPTEVI